MADELDINLRPVKDVANRILILASLCRRAFLETPDASRELHDETNSERFDLLAWLQQEGLAPALTPDEQQFLETPIGALTADEVIPATWHIEALRPLMWAVNLEPELPAPYQLADAAASLPHVPAPWDDTGDFVRSLRLRSEEEIAGERERAEIWLWRAEIEPERRSLRGRERSKLETDIRAVVVESIDAGFFSNAAGGDFPVEGRPFRELQPTVIETIEGVAGARLHALNWLCGFGTTWADVPLSLDD